MLVNNDEWKIKRTDKYKTNILFFITVESISIDIGFIQTKQQQQKKKNVTKKVKKYKKREHGFDWLFWSTSTQIRDWESWKEKKVITFIIHI